jgi:23S rRNA pseudouridine1911/1915/1917 synthase
MPGAKKSVLKYRMLGARGPFHLVEVTLGTGRYHQIRAQFAAAGVPLVGDAKYGSRIRLPDGAIALHHIRLEVAHPVSRQVQVFTAPYPPGGVW